MNVQSLLGNFALILFILMVISGVVWFYDKLVLVKKRKAAAEIALAAYDERNARMKAEGIKVDDSGQGNPERKTDEAADVGGIFRQLFPCDRGSIRHPFLSLGTVQDSTELDGPHAGSRRHDSVQQVQLRYPPAGHQQESDRLGDPEKGDVVVFKFPKDTSLDYIKRVVGVGGEQDRIQETRN